MAQDTHQQIAIIDFGSQYTHLISRRIRDFSVLSKIYEHNTKASKLKKENLIGIIISGGPMSVHDSSALKYDSKIFELKVPVLGLCYGHQLIAQHFGGQVKAGKVREYGKAQLNIKYQSSNFKSMSNVKCQMSNVLLYGQKKKITVWMSHGDTVVKLPKGFEVLASTQDCKIAAMGDLSRRIYGLQFHPEVHHTEDKDKILNNFVVRICQAEQDWKIDDLLDQIILNIKTQAQGKKVFMLVSGGVDSSVAFALLEKALGKKNVIGLHIDSGLMRKSESCQVKKDLARAGFDNLNVVDAQELFLSRLQGISDPEKKRKIIGETYIDAAEEWWKKQQSGNKNWLLGQGTIYPDTIETGGTKAADKIKTHHNRVDRIQKMISQGKVIEPLRDFYKDEVRELGRKLGLPAHLLERHPFPGPGLAIRVLCSPCKININQLVQPFLKKGLDKLVDAQILPIKSVGVQGDQRTYAHPLAVWGTRSWSRLEKISTDITNKYRNINRVVRLLHPLDLNKYIVQRTQAFLTPQRIELLRQINALIEKEIKKAGIYKDIWQFPVVLAPVSFQGGESIILRPVESREAMTANFYKMDQKLLARIVRQIAQFSEIDAIFYDITNKPPGTIEWE